MSLVRSRACSGLITCDCARKPTSCHVAVSVPSSRKPSNGPPSSHPPFPLQISICLWLTCSANRRSTRHPSTSTRFTNWALRAVTAALTFAIWKATSSSFFHGTGLRRVSNSQYALKVAILSSSLTAGRRSPISS